MQMTKPSLPHKRQTSGTSPDNASRSPPLLRLYTLFLFLSVALSLHTELQQIIPPLNYSVPSSSYQHASKSNQPSSPSPPLTSSRTPTPPTKKYHTVVPHIMALFIPFVLGLAIFWLIIGIMLAKFLAQKYKGKPWNKRTVDSAFIYGSAVGNNRSGGLGGGYGREIGSGYGGRDVGMGQFGQGRFKGL